MKDESRHADRRQHGPHIQLQKEGEQEANGSWARRQAFMSRPRGPDFLMPRHIGIEHMFEFPRSPHGDHAAEISSAMGPSSFVCSAYGTAHPSSTTSAVVRDGYVAAKSAAVGNAPGHVTSAAPGLPIASSTAVMLSAHCSKVGIAPGSTGSEAPLPGWSKTMSRPSEVIASTHPWMDGSSGRCSQQVNQFGTNTMSRTPGGDARYATRKSPFIA